MVLEFTMNENADVPFTEPQRRGYEQLLRKLLRMPGPPALLQLHHYAWWRAAEDGVDGGLFYYPMAEAHLYVMSQVGAGHGALPALGTLRCLSWARRVRAGDAACAACAGHYMHALCGQRGPPRATYPEVALALPLPLLSFCFAVAWSAPPLLLPPQYYDIPSVSLRSATWHLMHNRIERFDVSRALLAASGLPPPLWPRSP